MIASRSFMVAAVRLTAAFRSRLMDLQNATIAFMRFSARPQGSSPSRSRSSRRPPDDYPRAREALGSVPMAHGRDPELPHGVPKAHRLGPIAHRRVHEACNDLSDLVDLVLSFMRETRWLWIAVMNRP